MQTNGLLEHEVAGTDRTVEAVAQIDRQVSKIKSSEIANAFQDGPQQWSETAAKAKKGEETEKRSNGRKKPAGPAASKVLTAGAAGWEITVYTDPLCCWTWAMRTAWQTFLQQYAIQNVRYKMAGLLPSWRHFSDHRNAISRPIQMGPEWMHARVLSGAVLDDTIWINDPPASSYPACIAVKAAGLQGAACADEYFFLAQQAVMTSRRNIARMPVLLALGKKLSASNNAFSLNTFAADLTGSRAKELFRKDMTDWRSAGLNRLPAIVFRNSNGKAYSLTGFQTLGSLHQFACLTGSQQADPP
ncbi:DsbA family oxidoreductase [Puia sp. P3]|uniref:DsbA family oxidoreductase n=1 Tax=Puia sp. P3 TaxID=3423952 RepID=UPI003D67B497